MATRWLHDPINALSIGLTPDQELWGVALWVERNFGPEGWLYIAQQQDRLLKAGDLDGIATWRSVGQQFEGLAGSSEGERPS